MPVSSLNVQPDDNRAEPSRHRLVE